MENDIENVLGHIQDARGCVLQDMSKTRELALVVTKLDEAEMWLLRHKDISTPVVNERNG